jgi:hypothetical protein
VTPEPGSAAPVPQPFDQADGVTLPSKPEGRRGFLSDVIIELGLVPREVVDDAVEVSREVGRSPEEVLRESGALTEEHLALAIAERNGLPYVNLSTFRVDDGAARLIDSNTVRRYRALPIAVDATGALVVALSDPMDALAVNDIGVITKSEVRTVVASDTGIDVLLQTLPESKRRARLSAHGPDGFAGGRTSEVGEWSLSSSISSFQPASGAAEPGEPPQPAQPPAAATEPEVPAAQPPAELESGIDALVAAALDKYLNGAASAPAGEPEPELARTQQDLERAREEADQARAELEALTARLEQLEGGSQPPVAAPAPVPAPAPTPPPAEPASVEARLDDHLDRVMRELGGAGR